MNKLFLQKVFSHQRTQKYFDIHADETKAIGHYYINISLSESFYPLLSIFEVALRNSLTRELETMFKASDWYLHFSGQPGLKDLNKEITRAQRQIANRGEIITDPKVIAEMTLGFWVRMLNVEFEKILWKDLRRAFPFMPKAMRQRHNVSAPLNRIRIFRNRVYHNEPISWNLTPLLEMRDEVYDVLGWLNKDLPDFARAIDRSDKELSKAIKLLS
jgi:hypothetical protein